VIGAALTSEDRLGRQLKTDVSAENSTTYGEDN
jgi:hypothetical protein